MKRIGTAVRDFLARDDGMVGCWCLLALVCVLVMCILWVLTP